MRKLICLMAIMLVSTLGFGQSSTNIPTYFKKLSGVISPVVSTDTLSIDVTGTLTGNITGNAATVTNGAYINAANVFTQTQTISNTAPILVLTDTTSSAKSLTIAVDADSASIRESSGSANSFLVLDLANARLGVGTGSPSAPLNAVSTGTGTRNVLLIENRQTAAANVGANFTIAGQSTTAMGAIAAAWTGSATTDSYMSFNTRKANVNTEQLRINNLGQLTWSNPLAFAALGTPANGTIVYCSDCQAIAVCADSGTGAFAKRIAGAWVCN